MKASSASSRRARPADPGSAGASVRQPFTSLRFRVAIEGVQGASAVAVVFPTARIVSLPRKRRTVQFDPLVIRRGLTGSTEWYDWWNQTRHSARAPRRVVQVILLDNKGAAALRWIFPGSVPSSYALSPLNALVAEVVIESLELHVQDFELYQTE